jgi:hypothetical protein
MIKTFEQFTKIINKSDLDKAGTWSAKVMAFKDSGISPYKKDSVENKFVRIDYSEYRDRPNFYLLPDDLVDELNIKLVEFERVKKEYNDFLDSINYASDIFKKVHKP